MLDCPKYQMADTDCTGASFKKTVSGIMDCTDKSDEACSQVFYFVIPLAPTLRRALEI